MIATCKSNQELMTSMWHSHHNCRHCNSSDIITDNCTGDVVCRECGTVLGDRLLSSEAEWRDYRNDDRGNSESAARASMSTADDDDQTTVFVGGDKSQCEKLNRIQLSTSSKKEMRIAERLGEVAELCFKLSLPDVITSAAKKVYRSGHSAGINRLCSGDVLVAASVYQACTLTGCPRGVAELASVSGVSTKNVLKICKALNKCTDGENSGDDREELEVARVNPESLVARMASLLHLPQTLVNVCRNACSKVTECGLTTGTHPQSVAAGVVVLVMVCARMDVNLQLVSKVSFCRIQAIEKMFIVLRQHCLIILPKDLVRSAGGASNIPLNFKMLGSSAL